METENQTKTALLVIDVQQGLFEKSHPVHHADQMLDNINALVEQAHRAGAPVIYIQHCGQRDLVKDTEPWRLHPRLQPLETDRFVFKEKSNSFEQTNLDEMLKSLGVNHVVATGLVTHGCLKNGCLGARELGYKVTLAADAHSNFSEKAAEMIEKWNIELSRAGVEVLPTAEIAIG